MGEERTRREDKGLGNNREGGNRKEGSSLVAIVSYNGRKGGSN